MAIRLAEVFAKVINLLKKYKIPYLVIGGIAAGVLGEPRTTGDIDIDIKINKKQIEIFLKYTEKEGFTFNKIKVMQKIKETGTFNIWFTDYHIDFLICSTKFEENALKRGGKIKIFGVRAQFPSPEDLILFKVIPSRPIDKIDIDNIAKRFQGKLDEKYL